MSWDKTKPADSDLVFNSVGSTAIRGNFEALDSAWLENHVSISDASHAGKHRRVVIRDGNSPSTDADEIALYANETSLTSAVDGQELYFKRQSNGDYWPITAAKKQANTGWTYLPSGILIKWGQDTGTGDDSYTFPTGTTYKSFTSVYQATLTPYDSTSGDVDKTVRLKTLSTTGFTYYAGTRTTTGSATVTFSWIVIGKGI